MVLFIFNHLNMARHETNKFEIIVARVMYLCVGI